MNAKKIEELYTHPERLNASELAMLKQAVSDFPYAAPLQALYMKALQQQESYLLPAQVKRTAIATPNREALKVYFDSHTSLAAPIEKIVVPSKPAEVEKKTPVAKKKKTKKASASPAPKMEVTKPVAPKKTTGVPEDLSHLPEAVRNAILRSRALRGKDVPEGSVVKPSQSNKKEDSNQSPLTVEKSDATAPKDAVAEVTVSKGGSGYSFGTLDVEAGGVPSGSISPTFDVIIPPEGGFGADIYRELGAKNSLIYCRIENDTGNPDFITGNEFARVGIVQNPKSYGTSSNLEIDKASAVYALKLTGVGASNATFTADDFVTQTIGIGSTAVGRVISYDQNTQVLKYWQDRTTAGFNTNGTANTSPEYGFKLNRFTNNITTNQGSLNITGGSVTLGIHSSFTGISTVINSKTYYLGQSFTKGVANPEVRKYSGNIIYVDNRPSITRSTNQKEDIKVILQF